MLVVFCLAVFFCVYTYVIFPVLLHWVARSRASRPGSDPWGASAVAGSVSMGDESFELPFISFVLAVHNEADNLPAKIATIKAQNYPAEKMQIVIVSDGSDDGTFNLLENRDDVTWMHYEPAAGKPTALNRGVELATGEVIIFTDARQQLSPNAARVLVERLNKPGIAAVSGELVFGNSATADAANVSLYWMYEKWIRSNESLLFSTTGATGALYAIRKSDAVTLPADTLLDDFVIPIELLKDGRRTVLESRAMAYDTAEEDASQEFIRKVRTLAGNYQAFSRHKWLFSPASNKVWWQFLSHKVARLLVPYAMLIAFIASILSTSPILMLMAWLQAAFYIAGLLGLLSPSLSGGKVVNIIKVFLQLNAAAVVAAYNYFFGRASVRWKAGS